MLTIIWSLSFASQSCHKSCGEKDQNSVDRYNKTQLQMTFVFQGFD